MRVFDVAMVFVQCCAVNVHMVLSAQCTPEDALRAYFEVWMLSLDGTALALRHVSDDHAWRRW